MSLFLTKISITAIRAWFINRKRAISVSAVTRILVCVAMVSAVSAIARLLMLPLRFQKNVMIPQTRAVAATPPVTQSFASILSMTYFLSRACGTGAESATDVCALIGGLS